jgi:predicted ABC-type ATPase
MNAPEVTAMPQPELIIVGGANGSGKTTVALDYAALRGCAYLGADAIAEELSPGHPERAAMAAGKEFLYRVTHAILENKTVIIESTLAGRSLRRLILEARAVGFAVSIVYVFLDSADACVQRVSERVKKGGHSVPEPDIRRRFHRSLANFWHFYRPLADNWTLLYNSTEEIVDVATGSPSASMARQEGLFSTFQRLVSISDNG